MATNTDSGINNISTIIRGNVALLSGKWSAAAGVTAIIIDTGGTAVIAADVTKSDTSGSGAVTGKPILVAFTTTPGNPNLVLTPNSTSDKGQYWAFVQLS